MPPHSPSGAGDDAPAPREALEGPARQVRLLTHAVDELTVERQWRNNELRGRDDGFIPEPVVGLSLDPAAADWEVNHLGRDGRPRPEPPRRPGRQTLFD